MLTALTVPVMQLLVTSIGLGSVTPNTAAGGRGDHDDVDAEALGEAAVLHVDIGTAGTGGTIALDLRFLGSFSLRAFGCSSPALKKIR